MAQVPYNPVPQGRPVSETPQVRLNVPGAAFGVNIGEALTRRGGALTEFGNDIFGAAQTIQAQVNEASARKSLVDFEQAVGTEKAKFDALPPNMKMDSLPAHYQKLRDIQDQFTSGMGLNEAQMFRRESSPFIGRNIFSSAAEAGHAWKEYQRDEYIYDTEKRGNYWGTASPNEVVSKIQDHNDSIDSANRAGVTGYGPNQTSARKENAGSTYMLKSVITLANRGDDRSIEQAAANLEAYKAGIKLPDGTVATITSEHYDQAQKVLETAQAAQGRVFGDNLHKDGTPQESAFKQIEERAATVPGTDLTRNKWADNAKSEYLKDKLYVKRALDDQKRDNQHSVLEMLNEPDQTSPTGYRYNSVKDFRSNPRGSAIIKGMDASEQLDVDKMIRDRIKKRDDDLIQTTKQILEGQFHDNPQGALQINLMDDRIHVDWDTRMKLVKEQKALLRNPEVNPNTQMASSWMLNSKYGAALDSLGLSRRPGADADQATKDQYYQYKGILRTGIETFIRDNQRMPSQQEFMEKIAPNVLKESASTFSWLGVGPSYSLGGPAAVPISDKALQQSKDELTKEAIKRKMPMPTDADAQEHALMKNWHLLLQIQGGKGAATQPAQPAGPAGKPALPNVPQSQ